MFRATKTLMYSRPDVFRAAQKNTQSVIAYLNAQIDAGVLKR